MEIPAELSDVIMQQDGIEKGNTEYTNTKVRKILSVIKNQTSRETGASFPGVVNDADYKAGLKA